MRAHVAPIFLGFLGFVLEHHRLKAAIVGRAIAFAVQVLVQDASRDALFTECQRAREEGTHLVPDEVACAFLLLCRRRFTQACHRSHTLTGASTPRVAVDTVSRNGLRQQARRERQAAAAAAARRERQRAVEAQKSPHCGGLS